MSERNAIDLARLANIDARIAEVNSQLAELFLERSQVMKGLSDADVNIATGRKVHRAHEPRLDPVAPGLQPLVNSVNRRRAARQRGHQ